jgi:hypothetical protein
MTKAYVITKNDEARTFKIKQFREYQKEKVKGLFDNLLNELLSMNPKYADIIDMQNILNARKNVLVNLEKELKDT